MARVSQPRNAIGYASDLAFGRIMQRMSRFHAGSPAKRAGPGAVFRMTPKEVEQWIMQLHPLDVGTAPIASARITPMFIDPGAVTIERAVGHIDEGAVAPILVHARM